MSTNFRAGRFNYRSGRCGGGSSSDQSSRPNQFVDNRGKHATTMLLFHPQTREGGYATYATIYEEIISHVEQTYGNDSENILKSLEQSAYLTFPKMIPVPRQPRLETQLPTFKSLNTMPNSEWKPSSTRPKWRCG